MSEINQHVQSSPAQDSSLKLDASAMEFRAPSNSLFDSVPELKTSGEGHWGNAQSNGGFGSRTEGEPMSAGERRQMVSAAVGNMAPGADSGLQGQINQQVEGMINTLEQDVNNIMAMINNITADIGNSQTGGNSMPGGCDGHMGHQGTGSGGSGGAIDNGSGCGGGTQEIANGSGSTPPETGNGGTVIGGTTPPTPPPESGTSNPASNPANAIVQVIADDGPVAGGEQLSMGTGFFATSNGEIVTDYHVISGSQGPIQIQLADGQTVQASVVKTDQADDLALLKVTGGTNGEFQTLNVATDAQASPTDTAYGFPNGQPQLASVSGPFEGQTPLTNYDIAEMSQLDPGFNQNRNGDLFAMNIQPGDSGGPILNSQGQVVAITDLGSSDGQGFGVGTPGQDIENLLA